MSLYGRKPVQREAAIAWLSKQDWFATWRTIPSYRGNRLDWRRIADAVRGQGFYSHSTGTIDIPVGTIVREAMALRDSQAKTA